MEKIFYADKNVFSDSEVALRKILSVFFGIEEAEFYRNENGKPYLKNVDGLFFSVTHTAQILFIAFSDQNVGIDAELLSRDVKLPLLLRKFSPEERNEILSVQDFLRHWTVKESVVKWLGGTLARDLNKITYTKKQLRYGQVDIPVRVTSTFFKEHILTICSERNFTNAEFIYLNP